MKYNVTYEDCGIATSANFDLKEDAKAFAKWVAEYKESKAEVSEMILNEGRFAEDGYFSGNYKAVCFYSPERE